MSRLNFNDCVRFTEKAKTENSGVEVEVELVGYVRGIRMEPTSTGTRFEYLVSEKKTQAYCSKKDLGWIKEGKIEKVSEDS